MKNKALIWFIVIFSGFTGVSFYTVVGMNGSIHPDESWFETITSRLPQYSFADAKVWIHPPLSYYLFYPIEKLGEAGVFNLNNPAQIRIIPLLLMLGTSFLLADIIRRKFNWLLAGLSLLPFLFSGLLWGDGLWLNYEGFMWLFFALSFWLVVAKPKNYRKWVWVTLCAMVLCKEVGIALLLVIALESKNWKYCLASFALVPWIIWGAVANNDPLWLVNHAAALIAIGNIPYILSCFVKYGVFPWFVFTISGVIASIKKIKEYLPYFVFFIMTVLYGLVWARGIIAYELYSILYSGMLMVAIGFDWVYKATEQKKHNAELA